MIRSESSKFMLGRLDKVLMLKFVLKPMDLDTKFKMVPSQTINIFFYCCVGSPLQFSPASTKFLRCSPLPVYCFPNQIIPSSRKYVQCPPLPVYLFLLVSTPCSSAMWSSGVSLAQLKSPIVELLAKLAVPNILVDIKQSHF